MTNPPDETRINPRIRRRRRWWWIVLAVLLIVLTIFLLWVFRLRIDRALERPPTLPPAVPTAEGQDALYESDFASDTFDEWELPYDDGVASSQFIDDQLVVNINALMEAGTWLSLNYTFEDFILDVDAQKIEGNDDSGFVILFRQLDTLNYNRLDVYDNGQYRLIALRDGVPRTISDFNTTPAVLSGQLNAIRLTVIGDTAQFEVNGQRLELCVSDDPELRPLWDFTTGECVGGEITTSWVNADIPRGKIGLGVQAFTGYDGQLVTPAVMKASFDNLTITAP